MRSSLLLAVAFCLTLVVVQATVESVHDAQYQAALAQARRNLILKINGPDGEQIAHSFGPIVKRIPALKIWVIRVPSDEIDAKIGAIREHPGVVSVEQDGIATSGFTINDPLAPDQWALTKLRAYEVWDLVRINPASNITIAIADTGVDYTHEDLAAVNYLPGHDFVNGDNDPFDDNGHGTHVTGIIAATQNNAKGVSGLAPGVSIMPLKVLAASNGGTWTDVADAIIYAGNAGMNIVSLSIQGYGPADLINDAVNYATNLGTLVVACAGNLYYDGNIPSWPGAANNSFAVANLAIDENGNYYRSGSSNTGDYVDIAAPGTNILNTYPGNNYYYLTGCSMATPYVSALAALVWSVNPSFTNYEVRSIIESTALDIGAPGRDDEFGHGAINPLAAVQRALELTGTPVSTPVSTPVATPVATPVSTPVATPVSTPVTAPVSTPVAVPVSPPTTTPVPTQSAVYPLDDATVRNGQYSNANYGLEPTMYVKLSDAPDYTRQVYVKFPLSGLAPVGSSRVVIRLFGYFQSTTTSHSVNCYSVPDNAWSQNTITWNNKPSFGVLLTTTLVSNPIAYYEWDVTSYVSGRQSAGQSTISFAFTGATVTTDLSLFNSKEADVNRPQLAIVPNTPPPVPVPTVVTALEDATVRNGQYASANYGLDPTVYVKLSDAPDFTRQLYVKFPLSGLAPVGSQRAVIRLFGYFQSTTTSHSVNCYSVPDNAWSQTTITWNNKPSFGVLLTTTLVSHPIAYYEWDVTSYVSGRQSAGQSTISFAFTGATVTTDLSLFNSVEADVNRPQLAIIP